MINGEKLGCRNSLEMSRKIEILHGYKMSKGNHEEQLF